MGWCCYGSDQAPPALFASPRRCCTTEKPKPIRSRLKSYFLCVIKIKVQQRILLQHPKPSLGNSFGAACSDSRVVIYPQHLFIIVISILPSSSPGAATKPSTLPLPGGLPAGKPPPPLRLQKPRPKHPARPFSVPLHGKVAVQSLSKPWSCKSNQCCTKPPRAGAAQEGMLREPDCFPYEPLLTRGKPDTPLVAVRKSFHFQPFPLETPRACEGLFKLLLMPSAQTHITQPPKPDSVIVASKSANV